MTSSLFARTRHWRERVVGIDARVPLISGRTVPYINLDNAASTPALRDVWDAVQRALVHYSSVHRGTGFKSRVSTEAYDRAHEVMARFVGADPATHTVIFGKNTTEAINKLAFRYRLGPDQVVITTAMEHHSNDLPWRARARLVRVGVTASGRLDEHHLDRLLEQFGSRVALLTVTGASNVTGFVQPIHRLARKVHGVGGRILVDAAQLAPHRRIDMKPAGDREHIDFVALSGHKMYAPFGTGALVGPRAIFQQGAPEYPGGGTVEIVTPDAVHWADAPDRDEAGSPNVIGAIAMAAAAEALMSAGMDEIARHERALTSYALERLQSIPDLTLYGERCLFADEDRVGVIPFNLEPLHHALVAAILGYEGGIGVRNGCFCAQVYVSHLLRLPEAEQQRLRRAHLAGDKSRTPGMVRISFGVYNTPEDVDALVTMLRKIRAGDYADYVQQPGTGGFTPIVPAATRYPAPASSQASGRR